MLREQLGAIEKAIQKQSDTTRNAQEAANIKWSEIPRIVASTVNPEENKQATAADRQQTHGEQRALIDSQNRTARWTRNACIAAVLYAGIAAYQICLTRQAMKSSDAALDQTLHKMQLQIDAANTANANLIQSERPWMGGTVITPSLMLGTLPTSQIGFINTGKRPAKITDSNIQSGFYRSFPKDPESEYAKGGIHGIFISTPGGQVFTAKRPIIGSASHPVDYSLSPSLLARFNSGRETFFIFGKIEYSDVYRTKNGNQTWWTHICAQYVPPNNPKEIGGFAQCHEYNDAR